MRSTVYFMEANIRRYTQPSNLPWGGMLSFPVSTAYASKNHHNYAGEITTAYRRPLVDTSPLS